VIGQRQQELQHQELEQHYLQQQLLQQLLQQREPGMNENALKGLGTNIGREY
jgi:hypothetical protein